MTKVQYEIDIEAPVERVYEYYTNPDNIKEAWPHDIVKESEALTSSKNEEGSEMRVKGQYMGKEEEMRLEVSDKEQNRKLVTRQIQEFQANSGNRTHVRHEIGYELPTSGKIADMFTGGDAESKIRQGLEQSAQTVKQKLEGR
jgi:uncharacterized protein YndB with AHSA1/START domain